jgi:hypothetical protein
MQKMREKSSLFNGKQKTDKIKIKLKFYLNREI